MRRSSYVALFLAIVMALVGCSSGQPGSQPSGGDGNSGKPTQLTVGLHVEPEQMDPTWEATLTSRGLYANAFEALIRYNGEEQKFEPLLATEWKLVDELTWEFTLREGVKFHDGTPFTAEDVKFNLDRIRDPEFNSRIRTQANFIKDVEVVDEKTVRINNNVPYAPFLARISTFGLISKASAASYDAGGIPAPAGTGPFKVARWDRGQEILLEKNAEYWGSAANVDSVLLRIIPNLATRVAELRAGTIDIATSLIPDNVPEIKGQQGLDVLLAPSNVLFIGANSFVGPLEDQKVRQALAHAIDTRTIVDKLYVGLVTDLNGPVSPRAFGYNADVQQYPYDPDKAKALLAEAGYPNGLTLDYNGTTGKYLLDKELAEIIAQQLEAVGVKLNLKLEEYGTYWEGFLAKKNQGLYNAAIGNPLEDADFVLDLHFYSKGRGLYYNSPELDALIESGRAAMDVDERRAIYDEAMALIHEEAPWLISLETQDIYGVRSQVQDWKPSSYGLIYFGSAKLAN